MAATVPIGVPGVLAVVSFAGTWATNNVPWAAKNVSKEQQLAGEVTLSIGVDLKWIHLSLSAQVQCNLVVLLLTSLTDLAVWLESQSSAALKYWVAMRL